jgi:hypothetical protein
VTVSNTVTPPPSPFTVSFSYPTDGVTVKGNLSVGLKTTAPWGKSKTWTISVDGKPVTTRTNTDTVLWYILDTTTLANGTRTLTATVTYNGATATATRTITVANSTTTPPPPGAPTASFTSPASGATVSGTVTVGMASSGGAAGSRTFKLERVVATTTTLLSAQTAAGTSASFAWDTTKTVNGSATLKLTVTDAAGATATATRTVTVSNTATSPPTAGFTVSFSYPAQGATVSGNQTVGMATTAPWGKTKTVTLSVDGRVILTQTITGTTLWSTWNTTTVANGTRTLKLSVTYNGATATATRTVTVRN